jgi:hypothetical protein
VSSIEIPSYLNLPSHQNLAGWSIIKISSYLNLLGFQNLTGFSMSGNIIALPISLNHRDK